MVVLLSQSRESKLLLFSVVIPVFNRVDMLQKTLTSVIAQTVQNFEIIIVDDGSHLAISNQIKALVEVFSDQRISLIRHKKNKNGAAARNTGIKAAKGRFLCFLDSDDTWLPNKLKLVEECIQTSENQECFLIHHQYSNSKAGVFSDPIPKGGMSQTESVAHYSFVTNNVGGIQSSTICVPTELAKAVKFNESFSGHQDWDFALKVGELTRNFRFIEKVLTVRSKDSQDSVAESLDWQYSLWFYCQMSQYFENSSASYYFQRVVLKKAKFSYQFAPIFLNKLFFRILFTKPVTTFKTLFLFLSKSLEYKSRVKKVLQTCVKNKVKTVMIWGANDYAKTLISNLGDHVKVTKIIDADVKFENKTLLSISIVPIWSIDVDVLDNIGALILATDSHQQLMTNELSKISLALLDKIIEF